MAKSSAASRARRGFLIGGVTLAAASWPVWVCYRENASRDLTFAPLQSVPGYRYLKESSIGGSTSLSLALTSISGIAPDKNEIDLAGAGDNLCSALFDPMGLSIQLPNAVQTPLPVAVFTDYFCSYCRVLEGRLLALQEQFPENSFRITWHQWPLQGQASDFAARAVLAAGQQGAYEDFHLRLMGARKILSPLLLREIAESLSIDLEQLFSDMQGRQVERQLAMTLVLANIFGFWGTPSLVVGRTVIYSVISERRLKELFLQEISDKKYCL